MMKRTKGMGGAPIANIDDYLARVPEDARPVLEKLRKTIRAAAPKATEVISYMVPTFRHHGALVGFGGYKKHCAFYVMSVALMNSLKDELKAYDTAKGTIRFTVDKPLPVALVKMIVRARIEENEARIKA